MITTRWLTALFTTTLVVGSLAQCEHFSGDWFDTATEDVMKVTEASCKLTTKYGTATVSGEVVTPADGLLKTLGATGKFDQRLGLIEWTNGVKWSKSMTREVEKRLTTLETTVATLDTTVKYLQQQVAALVNASTPGTVPAPVPVPPPTNSSVPVPPPPAASSAELDEIRSQMSLLNATVLGMNLTGGQPGRDGYCTIKPNTTDVYIPVFRYTYRRWGADANKCTVGGSATRAGGTPGTSMNTRSEVHQDCRWTSSMSEDPMGAYVGDTLVFWRGSDTGKNVYQFEDETAFKKCDFNRATLLAGLLDFQGLESQGNNFSLVLTEAKSYYFASDRQGAKDSDERKAYCVNDGAKFAVNVMNPTEEVLATCPLYDPSKYGVSSGAQVDSASVARLKGAVAAIGRQLIAYEFRMQERVREQGQSGLTLVRSTGQGTDSYHETSFVGWSVAGMHNHADTHHTIGMGEFGAVLNGVQFTTRHNDYSLKEPDFNVSLEVFTKSWPPPTRDMTYPPVPPAVASAGGVNAQVAEMREWFRAFHTQNTTHRDYRPYFKPVLCYLEGAWINSQEDIAEPFASERHHIDADSWADLNEKTNFYFNSGQKNLAENLPFLPTCFRAMNDKASGDTFEPQTAQWFYRIVCKKISVEIPTARFRVKNELHTQIRESRPVTREDLAKTSRALYDMNPTNEKDFDPKNPWPKGKTTHEFIDELMEELVGFDGPTQGHLPDEAFGPICTTWDGKENLNSARYSRYYSHKMKDAMGRTGRKRAFNDLLFAAQTTNKRVSPSSVCSEVDKEYMTDSGDAGREKKCTDIKTESECTGHPIWAADEIKNNATHAKCYWSKNKCVYKKCWEQRWTYAIPLEIIYQTPLSEWNPYNINYHERGSAGYDEVTNGRTGKKGSPYRGTNQAKFYRTPASFFKDPTNVDPADTSGSTTYVEDNGGTEREVRASGHWILFPEIEGIGEVRQRYPIFPVHEHGSTIWKETKAIEELIMGRDGKQEIKDIISETRAEAYGTELRLIVGGGHSHQIHISPAEMIKLESGAINEISKTSSEANAHTHRVLLGYDRTKSHGQEWSLKWCSQSSDWCPWSIIQAKNCATDNNISCCADGTCPDGHGGVEVML
eukprot:TRINITY_DN255_c0_g1_i1.p1 TRINITY_DN255_c0_g1~~TRINITY_DN255_c0_g1_i1.p1  ORF type:complete len:1153 (+),score=221.50 TRINITY_DN255_c0_g1_i1:109-3459(+)